MYREIIMWNFIVGLIYVLINGFIRKTYNDRNNDAMLPLAQLMFPGIFIVAIIFLQLQKLYKNEKVIALIEYIRNKRIV